MCYRIVTNNTESYICLLLSLCYYHNYYHDKKDKEICIYI